MASWCDGKRMKRGTAKAIPHLSIGEEKAI
jgi:hypothetical protein